MAADILDLEVTGVTVSVVLEELDSVSSVHSGRTLLSGKGRISVPEHLMNDLLAFIEASAKTPAIGLLRGAGNPSSWRLVRGSYSYGAGTASIAVNLSEFEAHVADSISIGSTRFDLISYDEKSEGLGIAATAILRVPPELLDAMHRFHAEDGYHDVIRHGISDQPVRLRFGALPLWSQHDGFVKYGISLFDERSDREQPEGPRKQMPLFRREAAVAQHLAHRIEQLEGLINLLVGKGVLSKEEIDVVREEATKRAPIRYARFSRVEDVEDFEL